jgi:hypothetical protein
MGSLCDRTTTIDPVVGAAMETLVLATQEHVHNHKCLSQMPTC